jgi:putative serine protease PepD
VPVKSLRHKCFDTTKESPIVWSEPRRGLGAGTVGETAARVVCMGRWSIGALAAVALLAGCSAGSSETGDTLPPLSSTTQAPATTAAPAPTTVAPTTPPTTLVTFDAVGISQAFGAATVRVLIDHCGVTAGVSGFAIDDRHVVTSRDAVAGDPSPDVVTRDGRTITTTLIGVDPAVDVAVLRAEPGTFATAVAWGDSAVVAEGEGLTVIGYPEPGDYDVLDVSVRSVADDGTAFRLDVPLDDGHGGSPAFAADGGVVGVASPVGADGASGVVVPAAQAGAATARIIAAPVAPQTGCSGPTPPPPPATTAASSTVPASTNPGDTTTSTSTPAGTSTTSTTTTPLPGPGTGQESKGTWIMQLASARSTTATPAAIAAQTAEFEKITDGVRTLRSNDWPTTYPTPDLVVFYVGGFASKAAVEAQCTAIGLQTPDECLARFLNG